MIVGVGMDMIEVDRVMEKVRKNKGFREKIFSPQEITFCEAQTHADQSYAARFAAKEAFLKATGKGLTLGYDLAEIEVVPDAHGQPHLHLHGNFKAIALQNNWNKIHLSLSHLATVACAVVILEQ
ncbi:holo-ACP synthase [Chryseolinea soli]|uniref:Holo-[acyl-carrier-protein] synthase n=1 Tax=Chryseolinea soli TaxID=2321403 RepID=A0A385SVS7_9BACT|nr:holo-ACP synthase [Chryseolinea soli]AYB34932.1 holo-[acyl-carrier-protein] synthase [Chryseolinea soli]